MEATIKSSTLIKFVTLTFIIFILFAGGTAKMNTVSTKNQDSTIILQQRELLKEYALCQCLYYGFKEEGISQNDISLSFYNELSLYSNVAQSRIDSISKIVVNSIAPSNHIDYKGKKAIIYTCMQFYKSNVLDSLVKSLDNHIVK